MPGALYPSVFRLGTFILCHLVTRERVWEVLARPYSLFYIVCKGASEVSVHEMSFQEEVTERRSRVVSTPASYSVGSGFKSRCGDRLSFYDRVPKERRGSDDVM
jgi:hypothetical protein